MKLFFRLCTVCVLAALCKPVLANNAIYEQRRSIYIDSVLAHFTGDAITLQAYRGVPVDSAELRRQVNGLLTNDVADFSIVKLVRILYYSNGQYDSIIIPKLDSIPFWLRKDENLRVYWSENHILMWLGSDWLLHEKYGRPIDTSVSYKLRHYLRMKVQYGFYEFFSSVYAPYSLSGLLNLADFAQDAEIKMLATQAAQRLLKDILMLTNDQGVFYPSAGRNYYHKYINPYNQNHFNLIHLLTGMGPMPYNTSHAGAFLASSTLPVDSIIASWTPTLDTVYRIGHSLDSGFVLNRNLASIDKVIFQWSSGAYFHPDVVFETVSLLVDSNLWPHKEFEAFGFLSGLPPSSFVGLSNELSCMSKSSVISGQNIAIFKHNSITLSSAQDFWKGKLGYQAIPCVANVGNTAVVTASGKVWPDITDRPELNANEDLPYVAQKKNVALLMYRPEPKLPSVGYGEKKVGLYFKDSDFDEIRNDSMWLLGRKGENYVAVRRACLGEIDSVRACNTIKGQSWVIVVGDSGLYGNFNNFQGKARQSQFEENWYYDSTNQQSVYYAKVVFDTTVIDYAWGVDSALTTGIDDYSLNTAQLTLMPNPAFNNVSLTLPHTNAATTISVANLLGQQLYNKQIASGQVSENIDVRSWQEGTYIVTVETGAMRLSRKLVIIK